MHARGEAVRMDEKMFIDGCEMINNKAIDMEYELNGEIKKISFTKVNCEEEGEVYMKLKEKIVITISSTGGGRSNEESKEWNAAKEEEGKVVEKESLLFGILDIHLILSSIYNVPVLHFSLSHQDGSPMEGKIVNNWRENIKNKNNFGCSIEEHPIFGYPIHVIHGCDDMIKMNQIINLKHLQESNTLEPGNYYLHFLNFFTFHI